MLNIFTYLILFVTTVVIILYENNFFSGKGRFNKLADTKYFDEENKNTEENGVNGENYKSCINFIKYLTHIGGDENLTTIAENIKTLNCDKKSLLGFIMLLSKRVSSTYIYAS